MNNALIPSAYTVTVDMSPGAMIFIGAILVFMYFTAK